MTLLIGLVGRKQAGKDTVANYLVNAYGYDKTAFARPIKEACALLFQLPEEIFEDGEAKEKVVEEHGMSPRQMMQVLGTDFFRNKVSADFWLKYFVKWYQQQQRDQNQDQAAIVVSDLRFQNEVDLIKQLGGVVIKIHRQQVTEEFPNDKHISEQGVDSLTRIDHVIENGGSLEDLYTKVDLLMKVLFHDTK